MHIATNRMRSRASTASAADTPGCSRASKAAKGNEVLVDIAGAL
jgi:hypothetical protein